MSAPSDTTPIPEVVRERAAFWHVRLASDEARETDWLDFEAWLGEHPVHQRAYEAVEQAWADLDAAPRRRRPTSRRCARARHAAVSCAPEPSRPAWWRRPSSARPSGPTRPARKAFETPVGRPRVVALEDGTRITINGGSHLTATLGRHERRVVMADAEAVFDVAKDPDRPFLIDAGEREIRVVGTEFNVVHHKGDVAVAVRRGVVEVRPAGAPGAKPLARLTKGQALSHRKGSGADTVAAVDPDAALAWTTGRLVFQGERLAEVAQTLSRYSAQPIVVAPDAEACGSPRC